MRFTRVLPLTVLFVALVLGGARVSLCQQSTAPRPASRHIPDLAVGPQYDSTQVYVTPQDFDRFVASVVATFGGTTSKQVLTTVTPTSSSTISQIILTPVGMFSVFGYKTPVPYPFGAERTGYLVTDMDAAVQAARAVGADVLVTPFDDPIGRDAIIQFPGAVNTQPYVHTIAPSYKPLEAVPENRVYVSFDKADAFIRSFLAFSHGKIVSDDKHAPGVEIGRPRGTYRQIRTESGFGKMTVLVTDGHLPYPYGRETTGYDVTNFMDVLAKAKSAGVQILVAPYQDGQRAAAIVQFPGGFIAEIHSPAERSEFFSRVSAILPNFQARR